jgi:hypothetical protein
MFSWPTRTLPAVTVTFITLFKAVTFFKEEKRMPYLSVVGYVFLMQENIFCYGEGGV